MSNSTSGEVSTNQTSTSKTISAPTSPLKERGRASILGKVSSLSQVVAAKVDQSRDAVAAYRAPPINKDRCFTLLVIDDQDTDWSKYFRGKKIKTDYDIQVEQAEFRDLTVTASSDSGVSASIVIHKSGNKLYRTFKPDFLLIRQNLCDASEDHRNLLLGFQYGGIPSINSLESIYNFQDKPWVYAHMVKVQKRMGRENFPLIDQTFYPNHHEMLNANRFPCVFKIGHAHGGLGKVKVENSNSFQDMASVVAVSNTYCTVESYIEAKYDLHIFKIGAHYRAIIVSHCCDCRRKSLSGNWKTNLGQSILEEVPVTNKYKAWIDAVSEIFGGLAICSLEAVVAKDGSEYIIEVNDSATTLMGDSQEDDRRTIADMVLNDMEEKCVATGPAVTKSTSKSHITNGNANPAQPIPVPGGAKPSSALAAKSVSSKGVPGVAGVPGVTGVASRELPKQKDEQEDNVISRSRRERRDSQESTDSSDSVPRRPKPDFNYSLLETMIFVNANKGGARVIYETGSSSSAASGVSSASSTIRRDTDNPDIANAKEESHKSAIDQNGDPIEGEDTMKNLRKTFAGIFGELN